MVVAIYCATSQPLFKLWLFHSYHLRTYTIKKSPPSYLTPGGVFQAPLKKCLTSAFRPFRQLTPQSSR